ncbi:MAG: DUF559 domain-containing protein [Pseudolabrys sp.]|nr:DUF559 domain-containing protein [Pseudolabrys sp.]
MLRGERQKRKADRRVPRARSLRRDMTEAEHRLWWHLRRLRVGEGHFRRQATIGPYFADFAHHQARLVIELDGSAHMEAQTAAKDSARTRYLATLGYEVLRFWNTDVLTNTEGVMTLIHEALAARSAPHPLPLPTTRKSARGEGNGSAEN